MSDLIHWYAPWSGRLLVCAVVLIGLVVALVGWRRRRVVTPRCPRCGYDLSGSPSAVCAECGWVAASSQDRALFRGRRRWWLVAIGIILAMSLPVYVAGRRMQRFGWDYYLTFGPGHYFFGVYTLDAATLGPGRIRVRADRAPLAWERELQLSPGDGSTEIAAKGRYFKLSNRSDLDESHREFVVAEVYSGGAHCCTTMYFFALDDQGLLRQADAVDVQNGGILADRNGDGIAELVTCDWTWAYALTCYACLRHPEVILKFDGQRFRPAPELMVVHATASGLAEAMTTVTSAGMLDTLWSEMLRLIYTGHSSEAWTLFDLGFDEATAGNGRDRTERLNTFKQVLSRSEWLPQLKVMNPDDEVLRGLEQKPAAP